MAGRFIRALLLLLLARGYNEMTRFSSQPRRRDVALLAVAKKDIVKNARIASFQ